MIDFRGLLHKDFILKFRKQFPLSLSILTVSFILTIGRNCAHKQNPGHSCRIFMLLPPYWQFTASPLAVHCLHGGRCLPTALALARGYLVVRSVCTIFDSVQDRRHLGNKNKKRVFILYSARFALSLPTYFNKVKKYVVYITH